jgi:MoaA/NifB/PqqE/SkfB family radical SAM enzyme
MRKLIASCVKNIARAHFTTSVQFAPMLPTLYVTPLCNLRCTYCADFGAHRNSEFRGQVLPLETIQRLIRIIRKDCDVLYLTGGEPLLRPDIVEILAYARAQKFLYLAMNTNGLLLHTQPEVVQHLDNLVISMDGLDEGRDDPELSKQPHQLRLLLDNIAWAASLRKTNPKFVCTVTTVVRPGRVAEARRVMEHCFSVGADFSIQHLTVLDDKLGAVPSPKLVADPEFPAFLDAMIKAKRAGLPVSGSELYLRIIRDRQRFSCTPTAVPHIDFRGQLAYPCRELLDHVKVDLLQAGSLTAGLREGARLYGSPPKACSQCPDRCYVETAAMVNRPGTLVRTVFSYLGQLRRTPSKSRKSDSVGAGTDDRRCEPAPLT